MPAGNRLLTVLCYLEAMSNAIAIQQAGLPPLRLPTVSYGPFQLFEAVPWLMFATAMRIIAVQGGLVAITATLCANLSVFLALLLAARRMIELTDGKTGLGKLDFGEQLVLARRVLTPVLWPLRSRSLFLAHHGLARTCWSALTALPSTSSPISA